MGLCETPLCDFRAVSKSRPVVDMKELKRKDACMAGRLEGKVAVVTGAGNGMAYETTKLFVEEGAKVVAADIRAEDLAQWDGVEGVIAVVADITKLEDIEKIAKSAEDAFGKIDILCNIAGINDLSYPLEACDDERWDRVMDLDLKAPFRLCRRIVPTMVAGGGGSVINIGSYAALRGNHGPSYTAAKAGLEGLTKSIAFAYAKEGIRCNIIHPGGTMTNIHTHSGEGGYHEAQAKLSGIMKALPVNFMCMPVEIAKACLFLASDDSTHINGAVLSVDGGMSVC